MIQEEEVSIKLTPKAVFGLSSNVKNNIIYTSEHALGHPCSSVIVIDDMVKKTQSFVYLGQTTNSVDRMAVTPDRTHLAVAERGERPRISIHNLNTLKRVKILGCPFEDITAKDYADLQFTMDGVSLLALYGAPDFEFLQYDWEKGKVFNRVKVGDKKNPISGLAPNPFDHEQLVVVGCGVLNRMSYIEHAWKPVGVQKTRQVPFSSVCWINDKQVAGGTYDGRIFVTEPTELRAVYRALTLTQFSNPPIQAGRKALTVDLDSRNLPLEDKLGNHAVLFMTSFQRGFAFSCEPGIIVLFEEVDKWSFRVRNTFNVNRCITRTSRVEGKCNQIVSVAFSPSGRHFAVTTDMYEIYVANIFQEQNFETEKHLGMKPFESGYHNGPIAQISVSKWKPFLLTLGATDKSMRLWNYETRKLVNRFDFPTDVFCANIHPTGIFCVIGFSEYLTLNIFVLKTVEEIRKMALPSCPYACFSNSGHKIGAYANDMRTIYIFNTLDGEKLHVLKGHVGPITGLNWSQDDEYLWSSGGEGSIYKWDLRLGERVAEIFTGGVAHMGLALTPDGQTAFAASNDGQLRIIENGQIEKELSAKHKVLLTIQISHSGKMLFATGEKASIISFTYPLAYPYTFQEFVFHKFPITMIKFTYNDKVLISVSSEGTLCFWDVKGPVLETDPAYLSQMLIPLEELTKRDKAIEDTVNRMSTYVAEVKLNLRELTNKFDKDLESIILIKNEKIKDLEQRLSVLEQDCTIEMSHMKKSLLEEFQNAEEDRQKAEDSLSDSMVKQCKKYMDLQEKMKQQSEQFHNAESILEVIMKSTVDEADNKVKKYLTSCSELIKILIMKKYADSKQDEEIRLTIEQDCDKEISQMRQHLETILKNEEAKNHALKCENFALKGKFKSMNLKMEILKTDVDHLQKENGSLKKRIADMQRQSEVVQRELNDHIKTEDILEKKVKTMIEEKKFCEKDKLVTAHVAEEMRSLLEPQEYTIFNLKEQNNGLTMEIKNLHRREVCFKNEIDKLRLLQKSSMKENRNLEMRIAKANNKLKSLKNDISLIRSYESKKLTQALQLIVKKHLTKDSEIADFEITDMMEKELKPHEYKILQLISTGPKTRVCPQHQVSTSHNLVKENRKLMQKLNSMNECVLEKGKCKVDMGNAEEQILFKSVRSASKEASVDIHLSESSGDDALTTKPSKIDDGDEEEDVIRVLLQQNKLVEIRPSIHHKVSVCKDYE